MQSKIHGNLIKMTDSNKKWVVEYSKSQNAFHRSTVVERNMNEEYCRKEGIISDYLALGFFDNIKDADKFIDENYELVKNCRMYKNQTGQMFAI